MSSAYSRRRNMRTGPLDPDEPNTVEATAPTSNSSTSTNNNLARKPPISDAEAIRRNQQKPMEAPNRTPVGDSSIPKRGAPIAGLALARRNTNDNMFPPGGVRNVNAGGGNGAGAGTPGAAGTTHDSLTLGQLKAAAAANLPKEKPKQFDYRYDDTDTLLNELSEFYPYVEMPFIVKNSESFKQSFDGKWTEAKMSKKKQYMEIQLELIESPDQATRRSAQLRVLYLLQGCFHETDSPEEQLHWVIENAKIVRAIHGVPILVTALKDAVRRYNRLLDLSEKPTSAAGPSGGFVPGEPYDERALETQDLLGILYFIVEVFRTDETFGDELMGMSPPLPLILFNIVSGLRDRLPKGYPVKKLLLLQWKTLLACLGGMKEVNKAKALSRELAGLAPDTNDFTKASPLDITSFHRDTTVKYPTFQPKPTKDLPIPSEKLSDGMKPLPPRTNYHSTEIPPAPPSTALRDPMASTPAPQQSVPLPGTPAPTPPPSPLQKTKKQQYQTDPNKPFLFPYTRGSDLTTSLVPFAIQEADTLYNKHSYISLGLYQLWQEREECMREERGLGMSGLIGFDKLQLDDDDEEMDEADIEAMLRESKYEEEEMLCKEAGDKEGAKNARQKLASSKRLHRVDTIYKHTLPIMQSCVIVLLKLLLATVTGPGAPGGNMQAPLPMVSPTTEQPPEATVNPPTREEIDVTRHREITSKAVSAILILVLKWFKASHILKFHFVAQLLFDSNCLLLVLKMFGLSDVHQSVTSKNELESENFFRYCYRTCSPARFRDPTVTDPFPPAPPTPPPNAVVKINGEETEIVTVYSWRNFFTSINFVKILQKMTKHRSHRTCMLNQYKSSQILKRMLRVNHPMLQLQVLKLIKSQMPWCGRKWRQSNMKVITSIYLNCRPELRDEWLGGTDQDTELEDALPQEYALRALIQFYNKRNFPGIPPLVTSPEPQHRRTDSTAAVMLEDPALHNHNRAPTSSDSDVFPPRSSSSPSGLDLPYNPDGMIEFWLHEYEAVLGEVFGEVEDDHIGVARVGMAERDDPAWNRLDAIMRHGRSDVLDDDISDSESVVSVGELGEEARLGMGITDPSDSESELGSETGSDSEEGPQDRDLARQQRRQSGNENTWEHMSPTTLSLLPRSPAEAKAQARRRSSSSTSESAAPLRAVDLVNVLGDGDVFEDEEMDIPGPMPIIRDTDDESEREFGAVDEVEYAYGE